ncbi:3D domain-containing protein [uncultured Oscillibacter sp.]|uniref:3D domain-containing protein n=1 Tax=uncultured Oscillibacter sp. TaxID=876091 RepID=UPI0025DD44D7|nr:3D domain-containing protein [uncultured Oscillibacter sp.]
MSQRSEKYARDMGRRLDQLETTMTDVLGETAGVWELRRNAANRARREARRADRWRCTAWLAITAMVLSLCLTLKVKADATPVGESPIESTPIVAVVQEDYENEKIEAAMLESANVIEDCTVTWYTADTCGKKPGDPAYGITYSGLPVGDHLTCAVDPNVIPLYSDVFIQYQDGEIEQLWATDTGVKGNAVDIYTPDYDYAIRCGRQSLTVWWVGPEGVAD